MTGMRLGTRIVLVTLLVFGAVRPLNSQVTPADSAAVLLDAARELLTDGRDVAYEDLLALIAARYPGTTAGDEAARLLEELRGNRHVQSGRTGLVVWSTVYGAWLGVAVPAAFGAQESEPYGLGLLIGGPLGFFGSKAYARSTSMSSGQAGLIIFGSWWGTWQGGGWRAVLDIGESELCDQFGCFDEASSEAVFTALVVGGLLGMGTGAVIARAAEVPSVTTTMVTHGALWGTWYGAAGAVFANAENDAALAWVLIGGNLGLAAGALAAPHVQWTSGQARLISIAGFAGLVAGLGVDLLLEVETAEAAMLPPTIGATLGLVAAAASARGARRSGARDDSPPPSGALLNLSGGLHFDVPLPQPATLPTLTRDGHIKLTPVVRLEIFRAHF